MSDAQWLDGNALAGTFRQWFGTELTGTPRGCQSCCTVSPVAAHRLYRGAGLVLRCPVCADVALQITSLPDRQVLRMAGTWCFEIAGSAQPTQAARAPSPPSERFSGQHPGGDIDPESLGIVGPV